MKPISFVYEHNQEGKLIDLHQDDWVPGMYNSSGKFFKLEKDPRKIEIPVEKITLSSPKAPPGAKIKSKKIGGKQTNVKKAKQRHRCKRGRKFSDHEVLGSISKSCRQTLKIGAGGHKHWWITRPRISKQLRGFSKFDKGAEFSQFYMKEGSGKLYVWTKPGITINSSIDSADFIIEFKVKANDIKGKKS